MVQRPGPPLEVRRGGRRAIKGSCWRGGPVRGKAGGGGDSGVHCQGPPAKSVAAHQQPGRRHSGEWRRGGALPHDGRRRAEVLLLREPRASLRRRQQPLVVWVLPRAVAAPHAAVRRLQLPRTLRSAPQRRAQHLPPPPPPPPPPLPDPESSEGEAAAAAWPILAAASPANQRCHRDRRVRSLRGLAGR